MSIIQATDIKVNDLVSSQEILDKYKASCVVLAILERSDSLCLRLVPEFILKDSLLFYRHDCKKTDLFIKR